MKRFISSLSIAATVVVLLGGLVVVTAGRAGSAGDTVAAGDVLSQAEDGAADEDDTAAEPPTPPALLPIEVLLDQLSGRGEGNALPTGQRVLLSRDPFRRVVPEPSTSDDGGGTDGGADGGDGGGTDGGGTDGGGTDGGTDGGGTDAGTDGGGSVDACTGDENETVCDGVVVTVDGFDEDGNALVTVDGTTFTVGVEDDFATSFRVLAVNDPCVTLLYGDEAFSICVGSTVLK